MSAPIQNPVTVDDLVRLARRLTPLEKLKLIEQIVPELEGPLRNEPSATFEDLMAEADRDAVEVGHVDDSREAIYTRLEGE